MLQRWGWGRMFGGGKKINCSIICSVCRHRLRLCCFKYCSNVEQKTGSCHRELEFNMRQLLRESSIISNNCISSLFWFFLFPWEMLWSRMGFVFRGRFRLGSRGRFIPVLISNRIASNLKKISPVCWINSIPRVVGLPLHSLALRAGLNRKYQNIKEPHKTQAYRHASDHLICCHLQCHSMVLSCISLDGVHMSCLMLLGQL